MDAVELETRAAHHPPTGAQIAKHEAVRAEYRRVARFIEDTLPESREKSLAHTNLEYVLFWANAAIARREP